MEVNNPYSIKIPRKKSNPVTKKAPNSKNNYMDENSNEMMTEIGVKKITKIGDENFQDKFISQSSGHEAEHSESDKKSDQEDFLDKIINLRRTTSAFVGNYLSDNLKDVSEFINSRKSILHSIAKKSYLKGDLTDNDIEKTIENIHLKPESEKTDNERDLEVLEQISLNCIYSRESLKLENIVEKQNKYKEFYNKIIIGNLNWIDKKKKEKKDFFEQLIKPQKPKYLVISCSDSRVVVNEFTATDPGDVFTHRNIGNLVISTDFNCQSVLQYAIEYLKVEHILVIGHTDCGAIKSALSYEHHGLIDHWLKNIREVAEKHEEELEEVEQKGHDFIVRKLIELNIREQCLNLCKSPIVQKAWDEGQDLYIHGYIFEMETGLLKDLEVVQNDWANIQEIYKYHFKKH